MNTTSLPQKKKKKAHMYMPIHGKKEKGEEQPRITFKMSKPTTQDNALEKKEPQKRYETRKHTQSPSGAAPGTNTLISLDLAVVIDAARDSLLKYNWQPAVLSTEIVGAEPCNCHIGKKKM
jgi:hypothetical protein